MSDLVDMCRRIARAIEDGEFRQECPECGGALEACGADYVTCDNCRSEWGATLDATEWLEQRLDVEFRVTAKGEYVSAFIQYACGGPNIWIDTCYRAVRGYWGGDETTVDYTRDAMDIDGAARDVWEYR